DRPSRSSRGDDGGGDASPTPADERRADDLRSARVDEILGGVSREQLLHLGVAQRRQLEASHFDERRQERDRQQALRCADGGGKVGQRRAERRPAAAIFRRWLERAAPSAAAVAQTNVGGDELGERE